ncbi:hypothetical protein DFJ74DRAFT_690698 [Hyaloraphidium curvatum]|nr:hypothetical protein DFJ74DRAFT_690698 [Hyaloraphidium curvatum]
MKQRLTSLDVAAIVQSLRPVLIGSRLVNVYDGPTAKVFLLKFGKSGKSAEQGQRKAGSDDDADSEDEGTGSEASKRFILVESGTRLHTVSGRTPAAPSQQPSGFAMKLRKHLRKRRVTDIFVRGFDRTVQIQFGDGAGICHLIIELYAGGNIILTESPERRMLALLRRVDVESEGGARYAVGEPYPEHLARQFNPATKESILAALREGPVGKAQRKKKDSNGLRSALQAAFAAEYTPALVDHAIVLSGISGQLPLPLNDPTAIVGPLLEGFAEAAKIVDVCRSEPSKGYVILQDIGGFGDAANATSSAAQGDGKMLDFHPVRLAQHMPPFLPEACVVEHPTFDAALEAYFSKADVQKEEARIRQAEVAAMRKLDGLRSTHSSQLSALEQQRETNFAIGSAILENAAILDSLLDSVNRLLAQGMDWKDLERTVEAEKSRGNPVALLVRKWALERGEITVGLPGSGADLPSESSEDSQSSDTESDDDGAMEGSTAASKRGKPARAPPAELVFALSLHLTAHANATSFFSSARNATAKHSRALDSSTAALKKAEKRVEEDLQTAKKKAVAAMAAAVHPKRPALFFEKFHWFVSSEDYIVLSGKDAAQNELLLTKHLKTGDMLVHADVPGAPITVVKNTRVPGPGDAEPGRIPLQTLHEAGIACLMRTPSAWTSKLVVSAFALAPSQVTKSAVDGTILPNGEYRVIKGGKEWLPPSQVAFGFGILWMVDGDSHTGERRPELKAADAVPHSPPGRDVEPASPGEEDYGGAPPENSIRTSEAGAESAEPEASSDSASSDSESDFEFPDTHLVIPSVPPPAPPESGRNADRYNLSMVASSSEQSAVLQSLLADGEPSKGKKRLSAKERRELKKGPSAPTSDGAEPERDDGSPTMAQSGEGPTTAPPSRSRKSKKQLLKEWEEEERSAARSKASRGSVSKAAESASQAKGKGSKGKQEEKLGTRQAPQKDQLGKNKARTAPLGGTRLERVQRGENDGPGPQARADSQEAKDANGVERSLERGHDELVGSLGTDATTSESPQPPAKDARPETVPAADEPTVVKEHGNPDRESVPVREADSRDAAPRTSSKAQRNAYEFLDRLTANPLPDDVILHAIPVCAPWPVVRNWTYRTKLLPGPLKRGKAFAAAIKIMTAIATRQEEREALDRIGEDEGVAGMMASVKIVAPEGVARSKGSSSKR